MIFGLTCKDKKSRDLLTIGPIFKNILLKYAQDSKEKGQRASGRHPYAFPNNYKIVEGGGGAYCPGADPGISSLVRTWGAHGGGGGG